MTYIQKYKIFERHKIKCSWMEKQFKNSNISRLMQLMLFIQKSSRLMLLLLYY